MKISTLYGKIAESQDGVRGYVVSVNADGGGTVTLKRADDNEREFTVDGKNVKFSGDKIIFGGANVGLSSSRPVRLGRACVDENGLYLGNLEDFTVCGGKLVKAKIGKKNYPAERLVLGDVIIVKPCKKIKADVTKDGRVILKKGTYLTDEALATAEAEGEYVQANLKTL